MKRKIRILLVALVLICMLTCQAFAADNHVFDYAGLLTEQECAALEQTVSVHSDTYHMDVVLVIIADNQGKSSRDFADDYYDAGGFGIGPEKSGVLFLLNMDDREWYISTCGDAISVLSDEDLDTLGSTVVPFLSDGSYYDALDTFIGELPYYYANESAENETGINLFFSAGVGLVSALVAILVMRGMMNSKTPKYSASDYAKNDSFRLRTRQDIFLYSHISKTKRQESTNQGGSSVHRSSSGRSHGGRGGKF